MNKAEQNEIMAKIEAAAKKHQRMAETLRDNRNPQIKEVFIRVSSMADAFESVLEAFRGNHVMLDIWARD